MLPKTGIGTGPGGRGLEGLSFRSQTKMATRRLAEATRTGEGMRGEGGIRRDRMGSQGLLYSNNV